MLLRCMLTTMIESDECIVSVWRQMDSLKFSAQYWWGRGVLLGWVGGRGCQVHAPL